MEVRLWGHPPDPLRIAEGLISSITHLGEYLSNSITHLGDRKAQKKPRKGAVKGNEDD